MPVRSTRNRKRRALAERLEALTGRSSKGTVKSEPKEEVETSQVEVEEEVSPKKETKKKSSKKKRSEELSEDSSSEE